MFGDFRKRARTKPDRKPGDECARLRRLPAFGPPETCRRGLRAMKKRIHEHYAIMQG